MNKRIFYFATFFIFLAKFNLAQPPPPGVYNVTNTSWNVNVPGSFLWALDQALTFNATAPGIGVDITINLSAGIIPVQSPLPPAITLANPVNFTIKKLFPGMPPQGLDMGTYNGTPATAYQGLWIESNTGSSHVIVDGITFNNFYAVGAGPCILAQNSPRVTIQNCIFNNANEGINYVKLKLLAAISNTFNETVNVGGGAGYVRSSIIQPEISQNTDDYVSEIAFNTFFKNGGTKQLGSAILIIPVHPINSIFYDAVNADVRLELKIHDNNISNYNEGIVIGNAPYNRSNEDATFKVSVNSNTVSWCQFKGIVFASPYKSFQLENNVFQTDASVLGTALEIGSIPVKPILSLPYYALHNYYPNKFGFTINNTILNPKNNNNVFTTFQAPGLPHNQAMAVLNNLNKGVDIIKLTYPGKIIVSGGKFTNIRECLFNQVAINNMLPPINLIVPPPHFGVPLVATYGNGNIAKPIINFAKVRATDLKVIFNLLGLHINNTDGPYVVEFFKADNIGNLTYFLGKQTLNLNSGNSFTVNLPYAPGSNLQPGDRIGMTVTSLGTVLFPTNTWGTSEVSYFTTCGECVSDFAPEPGKKYILSAWVSGPGNIEIQFLSGVNPDVLLGAPLPFNSGGTVIDGWKKIDGEFLVPPSAIALKLRLNGNNLANGSYFDDIRIHPKDAVEKSYVYDPETMRLMAELDERNYATLYEYDEEGKLIRIKKETERGVMTIKESKNNKPIKP